MGVRICVPTINRHDLLPDLIKTAYEGTIQPDEIIIMDNDCGTKAQDITKDIGVGNITILVPTENLGCPGSWNYFMQTYDDYIIIANDDVTFYPHTIELLVNAADTLADELLVNGSGHSGNAFSLFLLKKKGFEQIGPFDENLRPAYYEDNDYVRRLILQGSNHYTVQEATFGHVGSATVRILTDEQLKEHHRKFRRNTEYYKLKWGGLPTKETYIEPFNGLSERSILNYMGMRYGY